MLDGNIQFYHEANNELSVSLDVKKTDNTLERTRGLLNLPPLNKNQGLWISPCNSVHTFGMKYPLDIIYLDRKNKVKKIIKNLKPKRLSFSIFAKSVLEVKAGTANQLSLTTEHRLKWTQNA